LFKKGKDIERGRSSLSPELPSPARDIVDNPQIFMAGEGSKG
jgi:hypothetical protein